MDPEDYAETEVQEVPDLFTELLHNGQLVVPVITYEGGIINFTDISLGASSFVTLIGPGGIHGLVFGKTFSARQVTVQSNVDLHIGGSLLGVNQVTINTQGSIYLEEGARIDAPSVNLIAVTGEIVGAEGSMIVGQVLYTQAIGDVWLYTDILGANLEVGPGDAVGAGDINIFDHSLSGVEKIVSLDRIYTDAGTVRVTTDSTIRAYDVAADNIHLIAGGAGSIEVGRLRTWASTVTLDAARYVRNIEGMSSTVVASVADIKVGLENHIVDYTGWRLPGLSDVPLPLRPAVQDGLSVLIDAVYIAEGRSLTLTQERDIIIDTQIVTATPIQFHAANIIFTKNGSIRNLSGKTALIATNELRFDGSSRGSAGDLPTIQGHDVTIQAAQIRGGENALVSGNVLSVVADSGFSLRTAVAKINAQVTGRGDLKIEALSSIELADVDVFDGDLEVTSTGNIFARDAVIATDRYSNKLNLAAAGAISFNGVHVGQLVEVNVQAGTGTASIGYQVVVEPTVVDDVIHENDEVTFHVEVTDPSRSFVPTEDNQVELTVDFGDGTAPEVIRVPYIEPGPEAFGPPALTLPGTGHESYDYPPDWLGQAVAVGDINGDGYSDLILGDPRYSTDVYGTPGSQIGRVLVYLGSPAGLDSQPATIIEGDEQDWYSYSVCLGTNVAFIGDVDGDGYGDIMVSAPGAYRRVPKVIVNTNGTTSLTEVSGMGNGQYLPGLRRWHY